MMLQIETIKIIKNIKEGSLFRLVGPFPKKNNLFLKLKGGTESLIIICPSNIRERGAKTSWDLSTKYNLIEEIEIYK